VIWRRGIVTRFHSNTVTIIDEKTKEYCECVLRGKFKKQQIKPIVGDFVEYSIEENDVSGKIENILPQHNVLFRPKIANVDQAVLITTIKNPDVDFLIVDKFLVQAENQDLECVIIVNKIDLLKTEEEQEKLEAFINTYSNHYTVIPVSVTENININLVKEIMHGKISTMAGMSGVGKSSLLNSLDETLELRIGNISEKLNRGKHTTTYTELLYLNFEAYIADTPGFANLEIRGIDPKFLKNFFVEFYEYEPYCGFANCVHMNEPNCAVKEALEYHEISLSRYNSYLYIYKELEERGNKKW